MGWLLAAVLVVLIIGVWRLEWLYSATRDHVAALERRLESFERQQLKGATGATRTLNDKQD